MYVHLTISSGKDILGPQEPYISFPHNFTKNYMYQNFKLFLKQLGGILPKSQ